MLALHPAGSASAVCAYWLLHLLHSVSATTQLYTDYTTPRSEPTATTAVSAAMPCVGLPSCKAPNLLRLQKPPLHCSKPAQILHYLPLATCYIITTRLNTYYLLCTTYYLLLTT